VILILRERARNLGAALITGSPVVGAFFYSKSQFVPLGMVNATVMPIEGPWTPLESKWMPWGIHGYYRG